MDRRATSAEVAREAGVSRATVSYVLNSTPGTNISDATAHRVLEAARKLAYAPSPSARALKRGTSQLVLAILPDFDLGPTYPQIFSKISDLLQGQGYVWLMRSMEQTPNNLAALLKYAACDIVVGFQPWTAEEIAVIHAAGAKARNIDLEALLIAAAAAQFNYLASLGHRNFGYLLPEHYVPAALTRPRFNFLKEACASHGLPAPRELSLEYGENGIENLVMEWLDCSDPVTAICAHTDEVAAMVLLEFRNHIGPQETALIGMSNRPISRMGITTVELNQDAWAKWWTRCVLDDIPLRERAEDQPEMQVIRRRTA